MVKKSQLRVTVLGGGKMGGSLARGWLRAGVVSASGLTVVEPDRKTAATLQRDKIHVVGDAARGVAAADTLVVAVKPQVLGDVVAPLAHGLAGKRCISIAAGLELKTLQTLVPGARWLRAMPNQPITVGAGATGLLAGRKATREDKAVAERLFSACGSVAWVANESLLHAVTGLSGSGPAFVAVFAEALEDAGVQAGLPRATARALALQTLAGAALQMQSESLAPAALKDAVTSPGGTTIAGIQALEAGGLRAATLAAVAAAVARGKELAGG